jgi:2-polyprenyl-3-methyl-5-hydroxy-6-metoxy-1,4-benzoquinol methylase
MKNEKPVCLVCEKEDSSYFLARKDGCDVYRCKNCGFIFVWPLSEKYLEIYSKEYFSGEMEETRHIDYEKEGKAMKKTIEIYLKKMDKFSPGKGKLLDVGAATGHFVKLANDWGWEASGVEISQYATEVGRKKGLEINVGNFESLEISENKFSAVTFLDVFEHFFHPKKALSQAQKTLKPGGILVINTPDAGSFPAKILGKYWHLISPPNHLNLFTSKNIKNLLEKNGFEVVHIGRITKRFTLCYIFRTLADWQRIFIWKILAKFLTHSRLGGISVPISTWDNVLVIARKKKNFPA